MFFFFKQKTAYEIKYGLVGSEMCIRDSRRAAHGHRPVFQDIAAGGDGQGFQDILGKQKYGKPLPVQSADDGKNFRRRLGGQTQ